MPNFRPITKDDKERYLRAALTANAESCEYCFGNLSAWADIYPSYIAFEDNCVYLKQTENNNTLWPLPITPDNNTLTQAMKTIDAQQLKENGTHAHFVYINDKNRERLEKLFPNVFAFHNHDEFDEYVYSANKFRTYSGKKLHSKKNHYNSFIKTYARQWTYEPLTQKNATACTLFAKEWGKSHASDEGIGTANEEKVLDCMLSSIDSLGFIGGVLTVDSKICGFTIGETCAGDPSTVIIHIEKATDEIKGSYPALASMFIQAHPEFEYINREEDMGVPGLRQSKLSYCPDIMIKKYSCHAGRAL